MCPSVSVLHVKSLGLCAQEFGGTLIGEDGLVVMAGAECIKYIKHMVSRCLMPFHLRRSSHYYEPFSPQQPPVSPTLMAISM